MSRKATLLVLLVIASFVVAGCGTPAAPTSAPTPTAAPPAQVEPFVIAVAGPMTGSGAKEGTWGMYGAEIARDEINAAGGINGRPIELVSYDDKGDPQEGALVAQRIVEDKQVQAVLGPYWSSVMIASNPIYAEAKMPVVGPTFSSGKVSEQGWTNFIRICATDAMQQPQVVAFAVNNMGRKKIAVFYSNDDYGRGGLEVSKATAAKLGAQVVDEEPHTTQVDTDFTVQLTRAQKAGAEAVIIVAQYNEGSLIFSQAAQLGLTKDIVFIADPAIMSDVIRERVDPENEGAFFVVSAFDPFSSRPVVASFREKFMAKVNELPNETGSFAYDGVKVIAQAMNAGATRDTLIQWVKDHGATDLVIGDKIGWNEKGDKSVFTSAVLKIKDHQFVSAEMAVDTTGL